jgi:hypothetical protein
MRSPFLLAGLVAVTMVIPTGAAHAATATKCKLPAYPSATGGFDKLTATKVSCATAKSVALAHYTCRTKHGDSGRCVTKVSGYACNELRTNTPTSFSARATCRKTSGRTVKTVSFTYHQTVAPAY